MSYLSWFLFAALLCWSADAADVLPSSTERWDLIMDMMRNLTADDPNENIIISPISMFVALTVAYEAASPGKTRQELSSFLGLSSNEEESVKQLADRIALLKDLVNNKSLPSTELKVAAGMYIQKEFSVRNEFTDEMQNKYSSEAINVDFSTKGGEAVTVINKYISDMTKGRVSSMLSSELESKSQALLVSGFYFYGVWKDTLIRASTKSASFHTGSQEIEVQMMEDAKHLNYYNDPSLLFEAFQIPFKNENYTLAIVCPYKEQTLRNLTQRMRGADMDRALNYGVRSSVKYKLPRMKISGLRSLKRALVQQGLTGAFEKSQFARMTPGGQLAIRDYLDAADLEIDEYGSKGGAGTIPPPPKYGIDFTWDEKIVTVDRPFMTVVYYRPKSIAMLAALVYKP